MFGALSNFGIVVFIKNFFAPKKETAKTKKHNFIFLGLLKYTSCDYSITAEKQKGHAYYCCTKKKDLCQEKHSVREETLTKQIKAFLQKVSLPGQKPRKF